MREQKTRVIAVANEKGGVGKTVTVVNLAACLCRIGKKVLVVDMDPQAAATRGLGLSAASVAETGVTAYEIIKDNKSSDAAAAMLHTSWEGLDLIPGSPDLAGADIELVNVLGRENRLKRAMAGLDAAYDFVFLDTPPSLSLLTVNVFAYAAEVIVPCQTHPYAYAALDELFDTVEAVREEINPRLSVTGVLATLFDTRTRVSHEILRKLKQDPRVGDLLFDTVIRVDTVIAESAGVGKPVVFYRSGSRGTRDYTRLAEEVLQRGS